MKKLLVAILSLSLVLGLAIPAFAEEANNANVNTNVNVDANEITPYALTISSYDLTQASKSGNTISASAFTKGKSNATKSYVRIDLYRKASGASSYTLWKSGTTRQNSSGGRVDASEKWTTVSGYTYKVQSTHTAYAGSTKETRTVSKIF